MIILVHLMLSGGGGVCIQEVNRVLVSLRRCTLLLCWQLQEASQNTCPYSIVNILFQSGMPFRLTTGLLL